ncbi:MAG: sulfotransferase [Solirubrobacteraceae bacterium]
MKADETKSDPWQVDSTSTGARVIDVLYVGGAGRSGSTVLALLLAQLPGFVAVGGVVSLWERGLKQNYLCGCGAPFRSCHFWQRVGEEAFGGWEEVNADDILRLRASVARYRHWPAYIAPRLPRKLAADAAEYSEYTARVYAAIGRVSGATTVIDNSHDISPALLLARTPGVRGRVVHLVRDSRGVVFSLGKYVARPEATEAPTYMPRYTPARASLEWLVANLPYHFIPSRLLPTLRIRYESLVAAPAAEICRILTFIGRTESGLSVSVYEAESIPLVENHMVSGNPHRLGRSRVELRLDADWRRAMTPRDRMLTTLLTLPLNLPYRYGDPHPAGTSGRRSAEPSA